MIYNRKKFNELLREMIEKSDFTIYALSKQSGINRTTIQKTLSGERILSEEQLSILVPFLQLTPFETDVLYKSHKIEQLGFSTYLRCESIKNLAENVRTINQNGYHFFFDENMQPDNLKSPYLCQKPAFILNVIYHLILDITRTQKHPYVYLFSPFDNSFITDILSLFQRDEFKNIKVTHLIPFVKGGKFNESSTIHNVSMLSFILPFTFTSHTDYTANYYYEESFLSKTQVPFPYYLITNNYVLLLSGNYQTALLLNSNMQEYYKISFEELYRHSSMLLQYTNSSLEPLNIYSPLAFQESCYIFDYYPSIFYCIDKINVQKNSESFTVFTYKGLLDFCSNGIIYAEENTQGRPFSPQERRSILEKILYLNQQGSKQFLLVNDKTFHPCEEFRFISNGTITVFTFMENGKLKICNIHEISIASAIKEFMKYAIELHLFHTMDETNALLHNAIMQISNDLY